MSYPTGSDSLPSQDTSQLPPGLVPPPPGSPPPYGERAPQPAVGQIFVTALLVVLAFTGGWLGNAVVNGGTQTPASARPYAATIWQAWDTIDKNYVDQSAINHQKMAYAMISAMVDSLGDTGHSRFLTPQDVKNLNQQLNNASFVGIGVYLQTIQTDHGQATIIEATIPNSPASAAGLLPGDEIIGVDGTDVTGKTIDALSPLIRGPEGTTVTLTIRRAGKALNFPMKRAAVTAPIVTPFYFAQDQIGYVQITGFDNGTTDQLTKALQDLQKQGATSLILDLRDNPGGLVNEAVNTASDFLPVNTVVVYEKDRTGQLQPDVTNAQGLHLSIPMVILVNGNTASAAEIVSLAINQQRDVPLIGTQTVGTDTVLIPFDLPDGSQVLLGVKQFLSPQKQQLKPGQGIQPTKRVALPQNAFPLSALTINELHLTEADILACRGLTVDTQLQAAIAALRPARVATCTAPVTTATPTAGSGTPTPVGTPGTTPSPTPAPKP